MVLGKLGIGGRASGWWVPTGSTVIIQSGGPLFMLLFHEKGTWGNPTTIASKYQSPTAPHGRRPPHHVFGLVYDIFQSSTRNEGTGELLKDMFAPSNVCMS